MVFFFEVFQKNRDRFSLLKKAKPKNGRIFLARIFWLGFFGYILENLFTLL
jgi:hypothetical protein